MPCELRRVRCERSLNTLVQASAETLCSRCWPWIRRVRGIPEAKSQLGKACRLCRASSHQPAARGQQPEDTGQRTQDTGQRTEDRGQRTEDRGQGCRPRSSLTPGAMPRRSSPCPRDRARALGRRSKAEFRDVQSFCSRAERGRSGGPDRVSVRIGRACRRAWGG